MLAAGCGTTEPDALVQGLSSCAITGDCPAPGGCFTVNCQGHACVPSGGACVTCLGNADCNDTNPCTTDSCGALGCINTATPAAAGCCTLPGDCAAANRCQQAASCTQNSCTYDKKTGGTAPPDCCNGNSECPSGATCVSNICTCGASQKLCLVSMTCISSSICCTAADCDSASSNGATCTGGNCNYTGCKTERGDCDTTAPNLAGCETNTATSATNCGGCGLACSTLNITRACSGSNCTGTCNGGFADCNNDKRNDGCETDINNTLDHCGACNRACSSTGVSVRSCTAGLCVSSCQAGLGNCVRPAAPAADDGCETDINSDLSHCGACNSPCPNGNACQVRTCSGGSCGFTRAATAGCCSAPGDCLSNACQNVSCTANTCVLTGKVGVAGCCNVPGDCPAQTDPCKMNTCAGNQCGTAPVAGCNPDMAMPDLSTPPDLAARDQSMMPPDLRAADLAGADLAAPDLAESDASFPWSLAGGACAVAPGGSPASLLVLLLLVGLVRSKRASRSAQPRGRRLGSLRSPRRLRRT
jgi:hypothetical protein